MADPDAHDNRVMGEQAPAAEPTTWNKLAVVCGAGLGLACGFGAMFFSVAGIFLKPIATTFGWGRADVALLPMLGMAGVAVGAPIVGYLADRVGWRSLIAGSITMFGVVLLALAMAPPSRVYFAAVGFAGGVLAVGTTAAGYLAILPLVFDRRFGMALGFGMLGSGLGGIAAPILANALIEALGWRQAYVGLALVVLAFGALAHQLIFRALRRAHVPTDVDRGVGKPARSAAMAEGLSLGQALATCRFWLIAVVIFSVSCTILGGFVHLASFASDRGMSAELAARATAMTGLGLAVSRVGVGAILDLVFAPLVGLTAFGLGAGGFVLLVYYPPELPLLLLLAALLLGVSTGAEGDLIPFLARKYFGQRAFSSIYGALFGIATLGGAVGPYAYGVVFDRIKSYTPLHGISALVCAECALAILLLGPYRYARSITHGPST